MRPDYDIDRVAELALALMWLELHDGNRAWKGYPWDVLGHLFELGLIEDPKNKAKSVVLTEKGRANAHAAFQHHLIHAEPSQTARAKSPRAVGRPGTLTDLQQAQVTKLLAPLCELPPDPAVRSQVQKGVRFDGQSVILFEMRPAFMPPHDWREEPIAKFTYVKASHRWRLYCMFRDLKWHAYEPLPESPDLGLLVDEVRADPTGIFWG